MQVFLCVSSEHKKSAGLWLSGEFNMSDPLLLTALFSICCYVRVKIVIRDTDSTGTHQCTSPSNPVRWYTRFTLTQNVLTPMLSCVLYQKVQQAASQSDWRIIKLKRLKECIFLKSGNVMLWLQQSHSGAAGATTTSRYWSAGQLGLMSDQQHAVILKSLGSSDLHQCLCQRVGYSLWTLPIAAFIWVISTTSKPRESVPALQAPVATLFSHFLVKDIKNIELKSSRWDSAVI